MNTNEPERPIDNDGVPPIAFYLFFGLIGLSVAIIVVYMLFL